MTMEEIFDRFHIEYRKAGEHHHARYGWIQVDCPQCSADSQRFRLGYNIKGNYFTCWSCGPKKYHLTVAILCKRPVAEIYPLLKGIKREILEKEPTKSSLTLTWPANLVTLKGPHKRYLLSRGFDPKYVSQLWQLKGISLNPDGLSWRIVIPIFYKGDIVSWTARSILPNAKRRYMTARPSEEKLFHKDLLFGEDFCRGDSVVVHEGPLDAISTGPGAVSTFGTVFSQKQVLKISKYKRRVICFDSSPEGREAGMKLAEQLKVFPGETYHLTLDAKDSGEASLEELKDLRRRFLWLDDDTLPWKRP